MGWEDRPYYRDPRPGAGSPLAWLWTGSVPLFTLFGIRVRAHASLLVIIALVLLLGFGGIGTSVAERVQFGTMLFGIILLHEFGHCFGARWTGGDAQEIMMTPLGGLAMTYSRHNWWSRFITVLAGPMVNVVICLLCGAGLFALIGIWPLGPWQFGNAFTEARGGFLEVSSYLFWIYSISYFLLLFNLLPIFPMDGSQIVQSILWKFIGYYRSMMIMANIGLGGSVVLGMVGIATFGSMGGGILLIAIALMCFLNSLQMRRQLLASSPYDYADEPDYSASLYNEQPARQRKLTARAQKKIRRIAQEEANEQARIDAILAKVSAKGMHSLTWWEKRTLRKATERQRQRSMELNKTRAGY